MVKNPSKILLPSISGVLAACIWGGWMPITKYSILNTLGVIDIIFLRFLTAFIIAIPFLFKLGFTINQTSSSKKTLILTIGSGIGYVSVASFGFEFLPASYGSIIPVSMTFFSITIGTFIYKSGFLKINKIICITSILLGVVFLVREFDFNIDSNSRYGILLFIFAGFIFALYNIFAKKWNIFPFHAVAIVSFYSFLIYFPIYIFFPDKTIFNADKGEIFFQIIYQGVIVSFIALLLFSYSASIIGSSRAALFSILMPVSGVLFSIILLGETISIITFLSMLLMLFGMFMGLLPPKGDL